MRTGRQGWPWVFFQHGIPVTIFSVLQVMGLTVFGSDPSMCSVSYLSGLYKEAATQTNNTSFHRNLAEGSACSDSGPAILGQLGQASNFINPDP